MRGIVALLLVAATAGCADSSPVREVSGTAAPSPNATSSRTATPVPSPWPCPETDPPSVRLLLGDKRVTAEVACNTAQRSKGLMSRTSLPESQGMLFLLERPGTGGFWMKNTLIPLSIAYMRRSGRDFEIVSILDMEPCRADPCKSYPPDVEYDSALEMNSGWFRGASVAVGAKVRAEGPLPDPQ
ncbi:MAG TPA: DUF192 domain-containing protein [Actinomycetota bacterium]|nr:DUF192 domain-containing protein [Actinomycetota bacterium]